MPPVTAYETKCGLTKYLAQQEKRKTNDTTENAQQRRKPKNSSKVSSRNSPRNYRKKNINLPKKEVPSITYDRDALLSLRHSPLSSCKPKLPEIPGVTVPKTKEHKEMPLSLKLKLLKRGIDIKDINTVAEKSEPEVHKQADVLRKLSLTTEQTEMWYDCDDVMWHSCVYNLI